MNTRLENSEDGESSAEYKCALCPYSTKLNQNLKRHIETHLDDKLFKCPQCPFKSTLEPVVQSHVKNVHEPQPRPFPCQHPGCNYAAKGKGTLKLHSKIHSDEKSLVCSHPNCNYSTNRKDHFTAHTRIHTGEKPFVCQFESCSFATARSSSLVTHSRTHTKERPFKCPEPNCEYSAAEKGALKSHQLTHKPKEGEERPLFSCSLCEYSGKSKDHLSKHINSKHVLLKSIACPVDSCEFRCSRKDSLVNHLKSIHSDEKQYKCELCPFRAKKRGNVTTHLKNVHSDSDLRPFKCTNPQCDFAAKTNPYLNKHLLTHTSEKKHSCSFPGCNFRAVTKVQVHRHKYNIHSDEKKEKCSLCDYSCKMKSSLTKHMRIHTKEEPYKCKEQNCRYRAKQGNLLKEHQKRHHPHIF